MSIHDETWDRPICNYCKKTIKYGEHSNHLQCKDIRWKELYDKPNKQSKSFHVSEVENERDMIFIESLCPELDKTKIKLIIAYYRLKKYIQPM